MTLDQTRSWPEQLSQMFEGVRDGSWRLRIVRYVDPTLPLALWTTLVTRIELRHYRSYGDSPLDHIYIAVPDSCWCSPGRR